ncbi:MAG: cupin domain-containing protein [Terriglobales bacterium]
MSPAVRSRDARQSAAAPATLAELLAPRPKTAFLARHWQREYALVRGRRGRFEQLLPWAELNRILNEHRLAAPRWRLYRAGRQVSGGGEPALRAAAPLADELRRGATLIVDSVEELHPPLRRLAASLERELDCGVQVNAYAGWRATRGFDLHWDDHDVFILQVYGSKQWQVFGATRPHPLPGDAVPRPRRRPLWSGTLRSGDLLYLPRGAWHVAVPRGEPTLHLTVGFHTETGLDLLAWWAARARRLEIARRDVPRLAPAAERREYAEALWRAAARLWQPGLLEEYLSERDNERRTRPSHGLPYTALAQPLAGAAAQAPSPSRLRWAAPRRARWQRSAEALKIDALGRTWHFDAAAEPLLLRLADGAAHSLREILGARPRGVSAAQVRELLTQLLRQGLLALEA